jgi:23S rRNA pseudouridine1911/1915/1917 synthase
MSPLPTGEGTVTVPASVRGRVDKVLASLLPEFSRARWQKVLAEGRVWREEIPLVQKDSVFPGDVLSYSIPENKVLPVRPVPMELDILHEEADFLVLNKRAGIVVHPGAGTGEDTLVHGLLHHCKGNLSGIGGTERPGIVHRLDKETSGLLLVAKSDAGYQGLARQFAERSLKKVYICYVVGVPEPRQGRIEAPIGRHPTQRTRMAVREDGREAVSEFEVEEVFGKLASRVGVRILTGRTHQVRVHLKAIGHPLLGDHLYGGRRVESFPVPVNRVLLHAAELELQHPITGAALRFEAPLPEDFASNAVKLKELHNFSE